MTLGILLLNLAALALAVGSVLLTSANYAQLPDRVPIHFGFRGQPDSWGPRPMIWLLPVCSLVAFGMLFGLGFAAREVPLLLALMNLEMTALFAVLTREQIQVALGIRSRLGPTMWLLMGLLVVTSLGFEFLGR